MKYFPLQLGCWNSRKQTKETPMKRMYLFLCLTLLCMNFGACSDDEGKDKIKIVEMIIYSETGYGTHWFSDTLVEVLVFSDSDDNRKQPLIDIITEGFDFHYERGHEYRFQARKVWMANPPMDVSSIKYQFIGPLRKEKIVTENSEEEKHLGVSSELVKYAPGLPGEHGDESPKVYDALSVRELDSNNWFILTEIEGFEHEVGFEYTIRAKKITQAEPYAVRYVLIDIIDKQQPDNPE